MRGKSQTLFSHQERCLENPWLWKNEETVVPSNSRTSHELTHAMASPGSSGKHQGEELLSSASCFEEGSGKKSNALVRFLMT